MSGQKFKTHHEQALQTIAQNLKYTRKPIERKFIKLVSQYFKGEKLTNDEIGVLKIFIDEYFLKLKQAKQDKRKKELLSKEKIKERKLFDNQKYIIGGLFISYLKKALDSDNENKKLLYKNFKEYLLDNAKDNEDKRYSDKHKLRLLFDKIEHEQCSDKKPQTDD